MSSDSKNKQKILKSATRLILTKGAQNTSLADIAKEVGISKGTLYYYYSTKSDLIGDITQIHVNRITENIVRGVDEIKSTSTPEEVLNFMFDSILNGEHHGKLHLLLIQEAITNNQTVLTKFREIYLHWKDLIYGKLSEILDPKYDIDVLSRIVLSCIDGAVIQNMIGLWDNSTEPVIHYLLDKPDQEA
jgi:AcrR family transcriptional regulator